MTEPYACDCEHDLWTKNANIKRIKTKKISTAYRVTTAPRQSDSVFTFPSSSCPAQFAYATPAQEVAMYQNIDTKLQELAQRHDGESDPQTKYTTDIW